MRADGAGTLGAVGEVGGDEQAPLRAFGHHLQSLHPAGDDTADGEGDGLAALDRRVEDGAVEQLAGVVHLNLVGGRRADALALFDDLVLQAAGRGLDLDALAVLAKERLARLLVELGHLGLLLLMLALELLGQFVDLFAGLVHCQTRSHTVEDGGHAVGEVLDVKLGDTRLLIRKADIEAKRIAEFVKFFFCHNGIMEEMS